MDALNVVPTRGFAAAAVLARFTAGLTWMWMVATRIRDDWLADALRITGRHSSVPGWDRMADWLLAHEAGAGLVLGIIEVTLGLALLFGILTRWSGWATTAYAALWVAVFWAVPKAGPGIPESFPVPIGGWPWLLLPLVLLPAVAAATRAGRWGGVDAALRRWWPRNRIVESST